MAGTPGVGVLAGCSPPTVTSKMGPMEPAGSSTLGRRLGASLAALRAVVVQPELRRAQAAFALAWTGEAALTVALGVVAFRDGGAATVGLVALLRMLPAAVASPVLSAYADRLRRERVLAAIAAVRFVAIGGAALVLHTGGPTAAVYALAVADTVVFNVFRPAHSALLPALCTSTHELTSANVVRGVLDSGGALLGPALAGVLLAVGSATTVFAATALLSLGTGALVLRIHYEAPMRRASASSASSSPARGALRRDTVEGLQAAAGHRDLRLVFGLGFAQTFVRGALNVLAVVLAFDLLGTGDAGVAVLWAAVGAGGVLGSLGVSLLVGSRHLGAWLGTALVLWGVPLAVIGAAPHQALALAMLAVVGLGNAIADVPFYTLPVRMAPDAVLGRVFGVFEALVAAGIALGAVATPVLIDAAGERTALVAVGLVLPVLALASRRRLLALDRRLGVRDDEIAALRRVPMLRRLPVPSIEHLASRLRRVTAPAGTPVFEQGDAGDGFYVITAGRADVVGDGVVVRTLAAGESFGEIALLRDVPRTATIRPTADLDLIVLDRDVFLDAVCGYTVSADAAEAVVARRLARFRPVCASV
ncbi:MAG TPA: MFS transporter [Acidimicrobiales bacterium]|nr:MFS transporter [Acidimicrobiales bacterium]